MSRRIKFQEIIISQVLQEEVLNASLKLALEFGEHWLMPIQERLSVRFPELTPGELNECNRVCATVMKASNKFIYGELENAAKARTKIKTEILEHKHLELLQEKYAWINSENCKTLLSQGIYYAYKDGLAEGLL